MLLLSFYILINFYCVLIFGVLLYDFHDLNVLFPTFNFAL